MIRAKLTLIVICTLLSLGVDASAQVIESGKFRFYELKQIRGEEDYTITRTRNGELLVQAKTNLPFAEQEAKPLVNATLRTKADLTPLTFEIKGPTLLEIEENTSVQVTGGAASVSDRGKSETRKVPAAYFTLSGYVPVTMEMMLVWFWLAQ